MTVAVANVDTAADTFGQWVTKTNQIATAMTVKAVTTDSNAATGNAAITGTYFGAQLIANTIAGGNSSVSGNVTISTGAVFTNQVWFNGSKVNLGLPANVQINGGNTTHRVVVVNAAAGNTLVVGRLLLSDLDEFGITGAANGQTLVYNATTSKWVNTNTINIGSSTVTVTSNLAVTATLNGNGAAFTGSLSAVNGTYTGTVNAVSMNATGAITGANVTATNANTTTLNVSGTGTLGVLSVSGNGSVTGNLQVTGRVNTSVAIATGNVTSGEFYYSNGTTVMQATLNQSTALKVYYANGVQAFP